LSVLGIYTALLAAFAWIMAAASGGRRAWTITALLGTMWAYLLWTHFRDMRGIARAERALKADGVELPDEQPIPIRLAESRESLVVSLVALALIALVFIAHFADWLPMVGR
jgi:hypothetical protein